VLCRDYSVYFVSLRAARRTISDEACWIYRGTFHRMYRDRLLRWVSTYSQLLNSTSTIRNVMFCARCRSIAAGFFTDMPLIVAPPTSVSIFLAVSMQQQGLQPNSGNAAVIYSGIALAIIGIFPPLGRFIQKVRDLGYPLLW
jgi:hypothetical protein